MANGTTANRSVKERIMESFCDRLPNCSKALALAEAGCERELTLREKVALKYNGRLCPFCACATGKFESVMARMREAAKARAQSCVE